jgi:hypothetical protein
MSPRFWTHPKSLILNTPPSPTSGRPFICRRLTYLNILFCHHQLVINVDADKKITALYLPASLDQGLVLCWFIPLSTEKGSLKHSLVGAVGRFILKKGNILHHHCAFSRPPQTSLRSPVWTDLFAQWLFAYRPIPSSFMHKILPSSTAHSFNQPW